MYSKIVRNARQLIVLADIIAIKLPLPLSSLLEDKEEYDAPKWIDTCLYRNESNIFTSIPLSISGRPERSVSL